MIKSGLLRQWSPAAVLRGASLALALLTVLLTTAVSGARADQYLSIRFLNNRGQALRCVKVTTVHGIEYVSDNNGYVAFYEPGLMDRVVWFWLSDPEHFPPNDDGIPLVGKEVIATQGQNVEIKSLSNEPSSTNCPSSVEETYKVLVRTVPPPSERFMVEIYDQLSGRPLPLAELTGPRERFITDSNGIVSYYDRHAMGAPTTFHASAYGYWPSFFIPATPTANGTMRIPLTPLPDQIANRLYRWTGAGTYTQSALAGLSWPVERGLYNAAVAGQDGGIGMVLNGQVRWFFGDTACTHTAFCVFSLTSALSPIEPDIESGLDLIYETVDGVVRGVAPSFTTETPRATWMGGLFPARDASGNPQIYGQYTIVKPGLVTNTWEAVSSGLARWDEATRNFAKLTTYVEPPIAPIGGMAHRYTSAGIEHAYFENNTRIRTEATAVENPASYEAFTPLLPGTNFIERDVNGRIVYKWRTGAPEITAVIRDEIAQRIADEGMAGGTPDPRRTALAPEEQLFEQTRNVIDGIKFKVSTASRDWNPYRERFGSVVVQFGVLEDVPSWLGELWWVEGDTPVGPFVYGKKVVTHDNYTFYNAVQYPFFSQGGGREIFFSGTHTTYLAPRVPTPRENYNMFMYRLNLEDGRVYLPVPVYGLRHGNGHPVLIGTKDAVRAFTAQAPEIEFFAYDRDPGTLGLEPAWFDDASCHEKRSLRFGGTPTRPPLFYVLPPNASSTPDHVQLYEYTANSGSSSANVYSVNPALPINGFTRRTEPVATVWRNPISGVTFPTRDYLAPFVADAGGDRCLAEATPGAPLSVVFSASRTVKPADLSAIYNWTWNGGSATGRQPTVSLPAGRHLVHLTTTLSDGSVDKDSMVVHIERRFEATSDGARDGYIRETTETSGLGGTVTSTNATGLGLRIGDDTLNRQHRSIVSFETDALPDNAIIDTAQLVLTSSGVSGDPSTLGAVRSEIVSGHIGQTPGMLANDFEAAGLAFAGNLTASGNIYRVSFDATGRGLVNRAGRTQLRLRHLIDDDNDAVADLTNFYAGEHATAANRPKLIVTYHLP